MFKMWLNLPRSKTSTKLSNSHFVLNMYPLKKYKGYNFSETLTSEEYLESLQSFEIREDDVFLVTYPKSGTIWTQQIIISICELAGGLPEYPENRQHMPWLEFSIINEDKSKRPSPRLFTSHLIPGLMPPGVKDKKSKVIYVMRNPKDVAKSYYKFSYATTTFEKFLDLYLTGEVGCSSWFDHIRAWHSVCDQFNILYLTYEEMLQDLRGAVVKISSFLGKNLSNADIEEVVKKSTFDTMKKDSKANYASIPVSMTTGEFMRKGCVGDWKNSFTVAQSEKLDKIMAEKVGDMNLNITWE